MQQSKEQAHIFIPVTHEYDKIYDMSMYAQGATRLRITIASQARVILHDSGTQALESLELALEHGAQVFLVSQCPYELISINCYEKSYFSCVQVLRAQVARQPAQRFMVSMKETGAKAYVRILPLLQDDHFECYIEQDHASSDTSSDVQIVGSIHGAGRFGNTSKITVPAGLKDVHIIQKSLMFLAHAQAKAYALPCFDVGSKDIHCTHGAAIGSIDENQLWYLQSRGISLQESLLLIPRARFIASFDPVLPEKVKNLVLALVEL